MTRDDIKLRIQRNLEDEGGSFFTGDDLNDSIQDGYAEAVAFCESIERGSYFNVVASQTYYELSAVLTDYARIIGIFNVSTGLWLTPVSLWELCIMREDWELASGQARYYWPVSPKLVAIFPTPTAAVTNGFYAYYKRVANTLAGGTTPEIPIPETLEFYGTQDLLDQIEEFAKASRYYGDYTQKLKECQRLVNSRTLPQHLRFLLSGARR